MEGFLLVLLSSIDLLMISSLGEKAIAAVGIFLQPKLVLLIFARSFAVGITQVVALYSVSEKKKELPTFLKQCTFFAICVSLLLLILSSIFMEEILYLAGADSSYIDLALEYTLITNLSLFFFSISIVFNAALTGLGATRAMLFANIVGNFINLVLNYLFIFQLNLGVKGAAIATLIGSLATLFVSYRFINRKSSLVAMKGFLGWLPTREKMDVVKSTFYSTLTEQLSERFGIFIYTAFVASLGVIEFTTHCICMILCDTFYSFGQGFSKASLTLSANLIGKHKSSTVLLFARTILPICLVLGLLFGLFFLLMSKNLIQLYSSDQKIVELGSNLLAMLAFSCIPIMISLAYSGVLRGIGYARYVAKYSFILVALIRPILSYLLIFTADFGVYGAWIIIIVDQSLRAFYAGKKFVSKKKFPIPGAY